MFGGYDLDGGDRNDVWHFSRSGGAWREVAAAATDAVPAIRSGHSAVAPDAAGTKFVVFGGGGHPRVTHSFARFNSFIHTFQRHGRLFLTELYTWCIRADTAGERERD